MRRLGIFAGLLLFVAACGGNGNGELTLAEYFQRFDAAGDEFTRRSDELEQTMEAALGARHSQEAVIGPERAFLDGAIEAFSDFRSTVGDIDPPAAVEEAHRETLAALDGFVKAFQDARTRGMETHADFHASILENADIHEAVERITESCNKLQAIAADNDIEGDLDCEV